MSNNKQKLNQMISKIKESEKFKLYIVYLFIAGVLFSLGRMTSSKPAFDDFCKKPIRAEKLCDKKKKTAEGRVKELEAKVKQMEVDIHKKELLIIKKQEKICEEKIAAKIKQIKKIYLKSKCGICQRQNICQKCRKQWKKYYRFLSLF